MSEKAYWWKIHIFFELYLFYSWMVSSCLLNKGGLYERLYNRSPLKTLIRYHQSARILYYQYQFKQCYDGIDCAAIQYQRKAFQDALCISLIVHERYGSEKGIHCKTSPYPSYPLSSHLFFALTNPFLSLQDARYVVKMGDVVLLKPLCCCGSSMSCRSVDAVFHSIWVNLWFGIEDCHLWLEDSVNSCCITFQLYSDTWKINSWCFQASPPKSWSLLCFTYLNTLSLHCGSFDRKVFITF